MYVLNNTDEYHNFTLTICMDNENNIDINIPTLLITVPCGLSFLSLLI